MSDIKDKPQYAEGDMVLPEDPITAPSSEFDPDKFLQTLGPMNMPKMQAMTEEAVPEAEAFDPQSFLRDLDEEQYGTTEQMVKTGLEGVAQGVLGPLAPMAEKAFGVEEEDILARARVNPITHGVGEGVGLAGSMLTGVGEGALMIKAGQAAAKAAGLAKPVSYAARVGSAVVQGAVETAVMQGASDASKMVLHDPETSAQSAIANMGLASALGGATGGVVSGVISPLWGATVGPSLNKFLGTTSAYLNGESRAIISDETKAAVNTLNNITEYAPSEASAFYNKIQDVLKDKNPMFKANITPYTAEEYAAFKTFLSPDGKSGYAIKPDGELISVFSQIKGRGEQLIDDAVLNKGAVKLDAFDINNKLPQLYGKYMDETSRLKFADEYAPKDWDFDKLGRPDIVMMNLNPAKAQMNAQAIAPNFVIPQEIQAALSGDPKVVQMFNELREAQHPTIMNALKKIETDIDSAVAKRIGITSDEIINYSEAEGGKQAMNSFIKEYRLKAKPISDQFNSLKEPFQKSPVDLSIKSSLAEKIAAVAQEKGYLGADIPQNKLIQAVLERVPRVENVADLARLNTTIDNIAGGDFVLRKAGRDMKQLVLGAQQDALSDIIGKEAPHLFDKYVAARAAYSDLSKISSSLADELGLGRFAGPETLLAKLAEKRSPEQFLRRLSPKGNAEVLDLLKVNFPQTLESIRQNELRQILKPAALRAKEGQSFNLNTLGKAIEQGLAGQPERLQFALPNGTIEAVQASQHLLGMIPGIKSSGTAGWMQQLTRYIPQSAAALAAVLGSSHNPFIAGPLGWMGGHVAKLTATSVPEAIKMSMLKFLASDKPIKAEGFKAMIDYISHVVKGEAMLTKATGNLLKSGSMVVASGLMPTAKDNLKLDKIVDKYQDNPSEFIKLTEGSVGHYLPEHQTAAVQNTTTSLEYLSKLKPRPIKNSPLDKEMQPTAAQEARYQSALTIANNPLTVLQKAKDGTIKPSDIQDIKAMYPALMNKITQQVANHMIKASENEDIIPYETRMGLSLLLGQPVDSTMSAASILAAQPIPKPPPPGQPLTNPKRGTSTLGKSNKSYMTKTQAAESDRE